MKTIYEICKEKNIAINSYQSDMYIPKNKETDEIVKEYSKNTNIKPSFFGSQDGVLMYEFPFAYDPFWAKK